MKLLCHIIVIALLLIAKATLAAPRTEVAIGSTLPNATLRGLNGPTKQLAEFRGKPLIVNLWASWCGPCRQEMGSLERLFWRYGGHQFNIIGISTDDYPDKALDFLKHSNTTFSNYIDQNLVLENIFGANRIPLTVLIDAQGKIISKIYGAKEWDSPAAVSLISQKLGVALPP